MIVRLTIKDGSEHDGKEVEAQEIEEGMFLCTLGDGAAYIVTKDEYTPASPRSVFTMPGNIRHHGFVSNRKPYCHVCEQHYGLDQHRDGFRCATCGAFMSAATYALLLHQNG